MKKAIRYLRFSSLGQSSGSIERQEFYTDEWIKFHNVELVDTFIDRGKSARTFDRPDFSKLQAFITKLYKKVDYLLVDQLDRFSRDAGEALSMVKTLQQKYNIQIVSVTEGITFDYETPGSFFRAGLQLLLAEDDNINRSIKVKGGIYTARAIEGRHLFAIPPYGYRKEGERKERRLIVEEREAKIVRFIFDAYLWEIPLYKIKEKVREMGFQRKGNTAIERILTNPVYAGLLRVKPFKNYPGGLFPAVHEPIINRATWHRVQNKMNKPKKTRTRIDDNIPLRGLLKCHCGRPLTGAASRGKLGRYYYYYKCASSKHNNISAMKAHNQFLGMCKLMSLPKRKIQQIKKEYSLRVESQMGKNRKTVKTKQQQLDQIKEKLYTVEEKWISNEINKDTYDRWYSIYNHNVLELENSIKRIRKNQNQTFDLLTENLDLLSDIRHIYISAATLKKREFVSMVFDNNLYYQNGIYRTPTMMSLFTHNHIKMKEKGFLVYEKKTGFCEGTGITMERLIPFLIFLDSLHTKSKH